MIRKIILAPDSYKGSLSAVRICQILEQTAKRYLPEATCIKLPVADGGEGLVDAMLLACGGETVTLTVQDPLGRPIEASYGLLPDRTAVIEMAAASGLPRLSAAERNPLEASSYGTGELIRDAVLRGCRQIILGLGGSATNDGGIGAAQALGYQFLGEAGPVPACGRGLAAIRRIDTSEVLPAFLQTQIRIACDVKNPLYGPLGAAAVFAPQKGAYPDMVAELDQGLENLADVIYRQTGVDLQQITGSGAAGGLAAPFLMLGHAKLEAGVDLVLDTMDFESHLKACDLVITGEGRTDQQSSMGKVLSGISRRASQAGVPVISISGAVEPGAEALYDLGMTALFATCRTICTLEQALADAEANLFRAASDIFRMAAALTRKKP